LKVKLAFQAVISMSILAAKTLFPVTTPARYLTGLTALNIPSPEGTGDWHFAETFEGFAGRAPGPFRVAGENAADTRRWLGNAGIIDARERLEPYRLELPPGPIYAADHYRAIADMVLSAVLYDQPFEDAISLDDWLPEQHEKGRFQELMETAKAMLTVEQWNRIVGWMIAQSMI
jgi:hypothetical protein